MHYKIAKIFGLIGGIWGIMAPLLIFIPLYSGVEVDVTTGLQIETRRNFIQMGELGPALRFLLPIAVFGAAAVLGVILNKQRYQLSKILLWFSGSLMLVLSLVGMLSIGLYFFIPAVLIIISAAGTKNTRQNKPPATVN